MVVVTTPTVLQWQGIVVVRPVCLDFIVRDNARNIAELWSFDNMQMSFAIEENQQPTLKTTTQTLRAQSEHTTQLTNSRIRQPSLKPTLSRLFPSPGPQLTRHEQATQARQRVLKTDPIGYLMLAADQASRVLRREPETTNPHNLSPAGILYSVHGSLMRCFKTAVCFSASALPAVDFAP